MLSSIKRVRDYLGADLAMKDLKPSHVQKWMAHRKADGVVVGRVDLVNLSIVINWAVGEDVLDGNPLAKQAARDAMHVDHRPRRPVATRARYDALLDPYEPDETAANLAKVFQSLRDPLVELIGKITSSSRKAPLETTR